MSDELRLTDELAACEARLAAMALPATAINRDELLYRAGWAAGAAGTETARLARVNPPPLKGGARRGIRLAAWSFGSAAVAAAVAVAVTLQWQAGRSLELAERDRPVEPVAVAANARPLVSPAPEARIARTGRAADATNVERFLAELSRGDLRPLAAGLLAARRPRQTAGNDLPIVAEGTIYASSASAKTARQLLDEMLPPTVDRPVRSFRQWLWGDLNIGDTT